MEKENRDQENIWLAEENKIRVGKEGRHFETSQELEKLPLTIYLEGEV